MPEQSFQTAYVAEDGVHELLAESGDAFVIETPPISFNNYQFVRVGDGMSTGEKIR
jgi:hypothetical protein